MKQNSFYFFAFALALLSACASTPPVVDVQPGMDSLQVIESLGNPNDRNFEGNREHWIYDLGDGKRKLIILENKKVVEMTTLAAGENLPSIGPKTGGTDLESGYCTETNDFGRYTKGGGCNLYGCWPPGGYCNQWGCTASGFCSVKGCPKKINSFICK